MNKTLLALAIAFLLVSIGVFAYQRRAKSCPLHDRRAGRMANILGVLSAIAGFALLAAAYAITLLNSF
jgi:hypothetical protein